MPAKLAFIKNLRFIHLHIVMRNVTRNIIMLDVLNVYGALRALHLFIWVAPFEYDITRENTKSKITDNILYAIKMSFGGFYLSFFFLFIA